MADYKRTKEVNEFLKKAKEYGFKIWQVAVTLRGEKYSNEQIAKVLGVHPKTVQAYMTNFTKAGKAEWKDGQRVHRVVGNYLKKEYSRHNKGLGAVEVQKIKTLAKEIAGTPKHKEA